MKREDLPEHLLVADGFDDAIIGVANHFTAAGHLEAVAYDVSKMIDILVAQGMTEEEAAEYFDYNIAGAYVGEHTPVFIYTN